MRVLPPDRKEWLPYRAGSSPSSAAFLLIASRNCEVVARLPSL
jgi:hypothetical protein